MSGLDSGESNATPPARSGILPSNVGPPAEEAPPSRKRSQFPYAVVLIALSVFVGGVAVLVLLWNPPDSQQAASGAVTGPARSTISTPVPAPAVGGGTTPQRSSAFSGPLPDVNGISCDALESTVVHIHVHVAIFIQGQEVQIPYGVGIGQPWQITDSDQGPFVEDGSCFYWIHTHTDDGVVHIEAPVRRRFTLGDFFAIWQEPLSTTQVGQAQGTVITYVNGQRSDTNPADIALTPHERIQLDVGVDVPPYPFTFAPGD